MRDNRLRARANASGVVQPTEARRATGCASVQRVRGATGHSSISALHYVEARANDPPSPSIEQDSALHASVITMLRAGEGIRDSIPHAGLIRIQVCPVLPHM